MIHGKSFPDDKRNIFFRSHSKNKTLLSVLLPSFMCVLQTRRISQQSAGAGVQAFQHRLHSLLGCSSSLISSSSLIVSNLFFSVQRISKREPLPSSEGHIAGGHFPFVRPGKPTHGKPGDGAKYFGADDRGKSNCQADFSCIIPDILSSPAIPGNIADIVELLKMISLMLSEDVNRGKMQVFTSIGLKKWI